MTEHNRWDICPGCATYVEVLTITKDMKDQGYTDAPQCSIKPYYKGRKCPCSECLVKMMCEDMCDKLTAYKEWNYYEDDFTRPLP